MRRPPRPAAATGSPAHPAPAAGLPAAMLLATALLAAGPPALAAQEGPAPSPDAAPAGLWWSAGLGAGGARFTCDLCARDRDAGPLARVAVGAEARSGLRIGVSGGGWTHEDGDVRETIYQAGLVARLEPTPGGRLHLIGGVGWSGYRADDFRYDAPSLTLGAGLDFPVAGPWVLSNDLVLDAASFGHLRNDGEVAAREVGLSMLRLEVSLLRR